jgi:hypothetical protein
VISSIDLELKVLSRTREARRYSLVAAESATGFSRGPFVCFDSLL